MGFFVLFFSFKQEQFVIFWDFGIPLEKKSQSQKSQKIPGFLVFFSKKISNKKLGYGIPEKSHPKATSGRDAQPMLYVKFRHIPWNFHLHRGHPRPSGLPCSDFSVSFCCPVEDDVTCETAHCDANEWCLETQAGPICQCGDDDFTDDWDDQDSVLHSYCIWRCKGIYWKT